MLIWSKRCSIWSSDGWISTDAAGLPILPGLVRYDEVAAGAIAHALRFTAARTQKGYVYPATHAAGSTTSADVPPMGARARLKAGVDISAFGPQAQVNPIEHPLRRGAGDFRNEGLGQTVEELVIVQHRARVFAFARRLFENGT